MPRILIVTPAPPGSLQGNRRTALRWARLLRSGGHRVGIETAWSGQDCELLVALHARRSHASLAAFREAHPDRPAILVLTGTDIYRDLDRDADTRASLELADSLVALQMEALARIPARLRYKARVIHQSVPAGRTWSPLRRICRVCVLGHLREEKNPFLAVRALHARPDLRIELVQAGAALDPAMADEAAEWMRIEPRYRWLGEIAHSRALRLLASSHAMVISSRMEGGAHVVSEAIAAGVPVLASDIPGNIGLLGKDYPGYFSDDDTVRLTALLSRIANEPDYPAMLHEALAGRRHLVEPDAERSALLGLMASLLKRSSGR